MRPGHVSVVIGGSRGIGRALACRLAAAGGDVLVVGRNAARLDAALSDIRQRGERGRHAAFAFDISVPHDMRALAASCADKYGRIDLLVVSVLAAGYQGLPPATRDLTLQAWQRSLDVNLNGVFLANRAMLPLMIAEGAGDIVNICSSTTPHGLAGRALAPAYSAAKFAVAEFSRTLAAEVEEDGIRVMALFPGPVDTPLIEDTVLSAMFGGRIDPSNFADAVVELLQSPIGADAIDPYFLPMRAPVTESPA
jgi:3-oxoacyl-[acyl-carrier protein] reductase